MSDREGIFQGDDPLKVMQRWLGEAEEREIDDANAMVLSTADATGMPDSRVVLLKGIDADGLVFFTNYDSGKGRQLSENPRAAINLHWKSLRRQVRARGMVSKLTAMDSDDYFQSRPLSSRIGAWASRQSQPLASKSQLMKDVAAAGLKHGLAPERPPNWGGFRLVPAEIEFWCAGEFRLHDRFRWARQSAKDAWTVRRLYP